MAERGGAALLGGALCTALAVAGLAHAAPAAGALGSPACPEVRVPGADQWPEVDGTSQLVMRVDVDGDGRADRLELEESHGSGGGSFVVTVTLADGTRLETEVESSSYPMMQETPVPAGLLQPGRECVLALTERLAFGNVVERPDPSLAWLMAETKTLRWIPGAPRLPESYTVRLQDGARARWISYAGGVHTQRFGREPRPPVVLARRGGRVLLGTFHGVILTDPARTRHAWIYVYPGGDHKLRQPSVLGARIEGKTAVIRIAADDVQDPPLSVRVDLTTGRLSAAPRAHGTP